MNSLRAIDLAKSYKSRVVVRDLSIEVGAGEVVGLLGPNGAGKTTAFYMIVGLVSCDAGRIELGDRDVTGLSMRDSLGQSLSGGERRRVEIARALAMEPRFVLLDEPFAGVDPLAVADIQSSIEHLRERGIGVLITDHNVRETLGICGRAYIVSQGSVIAAGTADQILANPQVREVYLGQDFRM